jgi:hypothetical protein
MIFPSHLKGFSQRWLDHSSQGPASLVHGHVAGCNAVVGFGMAAWSLPVDCTSNSRSLCHSRACRSVTGSFFFLNLAWPGRRRNAGSQGFTKANFEDFQKKLQNLWKVFVKLLYTILCYKQVSDLFNRNK